MLCLDRLRHSRPRIARDGTREFSIRCCLGSRTLQDRLRRSPPFFQLMQILVILFASAVSLLTLEFFVSLRTLLLRGKQKEYASTFSFTLQMYSEVSLVYTNSATFVKEIKRRYAYPWWSFRRRCVYVRSVRHGREARLTLSRSV